MIDGQKGQLLFVSRYRARLRSEQSERSLRSQMMLQMKGQIMQDDNDQYSHTLCFWLGIMSRRREENYQFLAFSSPNLIESTYLGLPSALARELLCFKGPSAHSLPLFPYTLAHASFLS